MAKTSVAKFKLQGHLSPVARALLVSWQLARETTSASGDAIQLLENYLLGSEFQQKLATAIQWASQESQQEIKQALIDAGIKPPTCISDLDKNKPQLEK